MADLSDQHWSPPLQRHWPAYLMGASVTWLGLMDDLWEAEQGPDKEIDDKLAKYRKVEQKITQIWREEGQHAFLHHLNAILGYQPLIVTYEIR